MEKLDSGLSSQRLDTSDSMKVRNTRMERRIKTNGGNKITKPNNDGNPKPK